MVGRKGRNGREEAEGERREGGRVGKVERVGKGGREAKRSDEIPGAKNQGGRGCLGKFAPFGVVRTKH
jgi:hypothetical protein